LCKYRQHLREGDREVRATVKVAPTYMFDTQAFVGATFTVALTYVMGVLLCCYNGITFR
jgi:hypothetical protein